MAGKIKMRQIKRAVAREGLDYYPTPPWATRALFEHVLSELVDLRELRRQLLWDPACGEGHMAHVMSEYSDAVLASDVGDYGYGVPGQDFFMVKRSSFDWIITNPPYNKATEFFEHAIALQPRAGVAMIARLQFLEGKTRWEKLFSTSTIHCAPFVERVGFKPGRWVPSDDRDVSAYAWFVWLRDAGAQPARLVWVPPGCRERLSRESDREWASEAERVSSDGDAGRVPASGAA